MAERVSPPLPPPPSSSERVSPPLPPPPSSSERVSPPHSSSSFDIPNPPSFSLHNPGTSQSSQVFQSGTYVVQVPKDQIYRVPPPENAAYVQQHQNPQQKNQRSYCPRRKWCCCCCFFVVLILVIVIGLSVGLSLGLGKLKNPEFQIRHFVLKNSSVAKSRHDYEIKLLVRNPNEKTEIEFEKGGACSLFTGDLKLGEAKFPGFNQGNDNSKEIEIVVKGLSVSLPEKMKNSMKNVNSKSHVSFNLSMNLATKLKKEIILLISCNFEVDTLARGTRVINQKCTTDDR
ncbi:Late embryogenesis abundant (LEA) hydroxyproline-rich glycoprotein family [Euphorbia peplus]|nr:Late embryogenesis abundant (LEA) hydroxyproline-rich glycoprotein family [Euphorbia peplus]